MRESTSTRHWTSTSSQKEPLSDPAPVEEENGKQGRQLHKHAREQARQHPAVALRARSCAQNSSTFSMPLSTMPSLAITFQWRARKVRMRRIRR